MKHVPKLVLVIAALSLSGCGIAYNSKRNQILKSTNPETFGPPPPANHQAVEMAIIRERLKDPDSAKFVFGGVQRDAIQPSFASPQAVPVWLSASKVNAKNSFGGYTGFQPWVVAWRNARPYAVMPYEVTEFGTQASFWQYLR